VTINALAADLVMDGTTLGRNILPPEDDGLIAVEKRIRDRRSNALRLTEAGAARFRAAAKGQVIRVRLESVLVLRLMEWRQLAQSCAYEISMIFDLIGGSVVGLHSNAGVRSKRKPQI
jgi:DNA-binding MarR family transcriptional regulator